MSVGALLITLTGALTPAHHHCERTYTPAMFTRAAKRSYAGTRIPPRGSYASLWRYARCQRPPSTEHRARLIWHRVLMAWAARRYALAHPPMSLATASWYEDAGATASGWHAYYGVANLSLSFGTRVRFCYPAGSSRCLDATVDDRGPYVSGREWDLNQNVAGALGFSGVDTVGYRVMP